MFLPPERRHPGSSPWDAPPPKRPPVPRGETLVIALVVVLLMAIVMAPMAGTSLVDAIWYLVRH